VKKYLLIIVIILAGLAVFGGIFLFTNKKDVSGIPQVGAEELDREVVVEIASGQTFSEVTEAAGLDVNLMASIVSVSQDVYDLSNVRAGRELRFYFDKNTGQFKKMIYPISYEEELYVTRDAAGIDKAERKKIDYEIRLKTVSGSIDSSLYESAMAQNIDERAVIALADVFAWTIDFGMGIRQGDTYKFIYEERYRNGQYVMPGKILAARFVNDGKTIEGFYFSEGPDKDGELIEGYFDPDGNSLQKIFLKNPVNFKYISSGFTTGRRYISAFNISTGHRAVDYAAAYGTPIVSVGDGTVTRASWSSAGYGNLVSIRHNATYSTNYGHMSKFAVKVGQHVSQGQVIGYVGSTGLSTGPHLHFEMVQNGVKVNPNTIDIPSGKAVSADKLDQFKSTVVDWQKKLDK